MPNINENPDYQLVMKFLQNIRPGDMDEESANQLMMIGQRMQGGGILSDREREMFEQVVGATDRFPVEQMDTFPRGGTNPDIMNNPVSLGAMSEGDMQSTIDRLNRGEMSESRGIEMQGDRPDAGTVMSLEEAIAAGIVMPTRPQARPMMTSPRPQMRR